MKRLIFAGTCVLALTCVGSAQAQALDAPQAEPTKSSRWIGQLALGAEGATIYGLAHYGPRGILSVGVEGRRDFALVDLAYANDRSREGLVFHDVQLGATRGIVLGPARLGGGVIAAWLGIPRQSAEGGVLGHFGAGLSAVLGVDILRFGNKSALAIDLRGDAAWLFPGVRPTGSIFLSARF
jgi:hypothetical protein